MTLQPLVYEVDPRPGERRFVDISGLSTEAFDVIKFVGFVKAYSVYLCRCRCGKEFVRRANHLLQRTASTCGTCRTPEQKCRQLHRHWLKHRSDMVDSFANNFAWFAEWSGSSRKFESLQKIDESLPHSESNSIWCRGSGGTVIYKGQRHTLKDLADQLGLTRERVRQRIRDWGIEQAINSTCGLTRKDSTMPLASTSLSVDDAKRLRALSFLSDENVAAIIKRLVLGELEKHKIAIDAMLATAEQSRSLCTTNGSSD